jgi:hypothetical protein
MSKPKHPTLLAGILIAAVLAAGCGEKSHEVFPETWSEEATTYFNENVPPLKNLPGKVYHYQVIKYKKGKGEFFANSLYIDGKLIENDLPNASQKVGGVPAGQLEGTHIIYTKEEGYKVATKYELGTSIYKALHNTAPIFFRDYL